MVFKKIRSPPTRQVRQAPPKRQVLRQPIREHPFIEAMDRAGKVLDSLGNDAWDLV